MPPTMGNRRKKQSTMADADRTDGKRGRACGPAAEPTNKNTKSSTTFGNAGSRVTFARLSLTAVKLFATGRILSLMYHGVPILLSSFFGYFLASYRLMISGCTLTCLGVIWGLMQDRKQIDRLSLIAILGTIISPFLCLLVMGTSDVLASSLRPSAIAILGYLVPFSLPFTANIALATAVISRTAFRAELILGALSFGIGVAFPVSGPTCRFSSLFLPLFRSVIIQSLAMGQRRLVPLAAIVAAMAVSWALFPTQISTLIMSLNPVEGITDVSTLDSQCSDSGLVSVVRGIKRQSVLLFRAGNSFIGAVWIPQWQTVFRSFHLMELPALIPTVKLEHVLVIGAGVGVVPHGMAARGAQVDLIEIDPVVARLALKHFGELVNSTRISLEVGDGREWVETTDHRYGLVVVDAFSGGSLPLELYSIEFMEALKPKLSENAVVAFNVLDISRWSTLGIVARRLLSTAQQAFKHVRVFTEDHDGFHNLVVLASDTRLAIRQPTATDALGDGQRNNVFRLFQDWELPVPQESSPILKDAGDELWDRTVLEGAESHWMAMRRLFKAGFWLRDLV